MAIESEGRSDSVESTLRCSNAQEKSHVGAVLLREKHCPDEGNQLTFSVAVGKKKQIFIAKSQKSITRTYDVQKI